MDTVIGNKHGDTSSHPKRDSFHIALLFPRKYNIF